MTALPANACLDRLTNALMQGPSVAATARLPPTDSPTRARSQSAAPAPSLLSALAGCYVHVRSSWPSRIERLLNRRSHSGSHCQETPCFPPGCPGFLGFRWTYDGKRGAPIPKINGHPGVSGLSFLWKVSCDRTPTVSNHIAACLRSVSLNSLSVRVLYNLLRGK